MTTALEVGFVAAWTNDAGINAFLNGRIFPLLLPDDNREFPAAVYQVIDNPRQQSQQGDQGTTFARVQVRLYARTYAECCSLRDAVVDFCAAQQADPTSSAFGSPAVYLTGWFIDTEQDDFNPELLDSGTRLFSKRMDMIIHTADL